MNDVVRDFAIAYLDIEQGTSEWHQVRLGKVTASRIHEVVARVKSGDYGASRKNYMADLFAERLTNTPTDSYVSKEMLWGTDHQADAVAAYEYHTNATVQKIGFVSHQRIAMAGCSPDGFVGADGLVEIKCPNTAQHLSTFFNETIDGQYIKQMQFQMACTGRKWCDFISFDPRLPELSPKTKRHMRMVVLRVMRNDAEVAQLEAEAVKFLQELEQMIASA